ncbi:MAG: isoleucine--tRNA ligase [Clostridium sp.]|nr:isoleucine--tRNA ligase [Clostridium sp.]MCM1444265.1 isoleucine--tRNA ligase [Candidatus Amulumruptor caecigallinarius]
MEKFKSLSKKEINEIEEDILKNWKDIDILGKTIEIRNNCPNFVFYDGPATANGMPGLHHMMPKFLKDTFCKYKTMQGYKVLRKVGWDTHGLPVELQVEKELGFTGKKDIEKYGIKEFNQKCRESVWKNEKAFSDLTDKMGQFIDLENPYVTYDNNYIETEWWILKKFFDEGLFYEGHKILPYCPRCGTGLASHEVAQGYKEDSVNTVIVPMKKKDEDVYFLVWTTTPWTLISNVALCVNPDEKYVKVLSQGYKFILAASLANKVLGEDYEILETFTGKDLEYMEYEQLIPEIDVKGKAFIVTNDTYVTMEDGTGIVHIAPAFGEDDANVGKKYNLPYVNPVGEDGKYLLGPWKGMLVFDADIEIIKYLKQNDKLFKKIKMVHNYPHCWRCDTPLLYYSKPSFYLEVTKLKEKIIENNKSVNWYPSYVGEKRFANWLENLNDWAISRNRYWGTPLPLWRCSCGHEEMIGSREELKQKAIGNIDVEKLDLHRPYVDEIKIKCKKCGNDMSRVTDVIDCWFDSGSMPYAQYHYPFENKELFESQFPADFISEGVDQTRGWFYTLMILGTFIMGKSPYKNVLVNDLLLDKFGKKMSKSKGNIVSPFDTIKHYGADTIRFYLPYASPVWTPIKFDEEGLKEIYSKYISTFKNTYSFFEMYANADNIDPRNYEIPVIDRDITDKWLISKLNKVIKNVTDAYNEYDLTKVTKYIIEFLNDDLSNWYIRSNRRRFWESELTDSKKSVYLTTYETILTLTKLTAPITPYISEEIYRCLTGNESVHLENFPKYSNELINEEVETKMDLIRDICSLGRFAREEAKIKVRQPISELILESKNESIISSLLGIIKEELNVKNIVFIDNTLEYMDYIIKPNFREVGRVFGNKVNMFAESLNSLSNEEISKLKEGNINIKFDGKDLTITPSMVDISIKVKEGYCSSNNGKTFVILNTSLTEDLIIEGLAREMVRNIQSIRKDLDLVITDRIKVYYNGDEMVEKTLEKHLDFIKNETLTISFIKDTSVTSKYTLNDNEIYLKVEKV